MAGYGARHVFVVPKDGQPGARASPEQLFGDGHYLDQTPRPLIPTLICYICKGFTTIRQYETPSELFETYLAFRPRGRCGRRCEGNHTFTWSDAGGNHIRNAPHTAEAPPAFPTEPPRLARKSIRYEVPDSGIPGIGWDDARHKWRD